MDKLDILNIAISLAGLVAINTVTFILDGIHNFPPNEQPTVMGAAIFASILLAANIGITIAHIRSRRQQERGKQ